MSFAYKLLYGVGFTPWEDIADLPAARERVAGLLAGHRRRLRPEGAPEGA